MLANSNCLSKAAMVKPEIKASSGIRITLPQYTKSYPFVSDYNCFYPNRNEYEPNLFLAMLHLCIVNSGQAH